MPSSHDAGSPGGPVATGPSEYTRVFMAPGSGGGAPGGGDSSGTGGSGGGGMMGGLGGMANVSGPQFSDPR